MFNRWVEIRVDPDKLRWDDRDPLQDENGDYLRDENDQVIFAG